MHRAPASTSAPLLRPLSTSSAAGGRSEGAYEILCSALRPTPPAFLLDLRMGGTAVAAVLFAMNFALLGAMLYHLAEGEASPLQALRSASQAATAHHPEKLAQMIAAGHNVHPVCETYSNFLAQQCTLYALMLLASFAHASCRWANQPVTQRRVGVDDEDEEATLSPREHAELAQAEWSAKKNLRRNPTLRIAIGVAAALAMLYHVVWIVILPSQFIASLVRCESKLPAGVEWWSGAVAVLNFVALFLCAFVVCMMIGSAIIMRCIEARRRNASSVTK